ncbi:MAG: hypothetical protein ABIV51_05050 [Saprospiraceae bacterium]
MKIEATPDVHTQIKEFLKKRKDQRYSFITDLISEFDACSGDIFLLCRKRDNGIVSSEDDSHFVKFRTVNSANKASHKKGFRVGGIYFPTQDMFIICTIYAHTGKDPADNISPPFVKDVLKQIKEGTFVHSPFDPPLVHPMPAPTP